MEIPWADGSTVAHVAAINDRVEVFRALRPGDLLINQTRDDGRTALHLAAAQGLVEVVRSLIALKADVEAPATMVTCGALGTRPALCAACNGHLAVLEALADAKADLSASNGNGDTPAYQAAENGHAAVVRYLWSCKADLNKVSLRGASPLYIAAQNNHIKVCRVLTMAQVDLNRMAFCAATPIAVAAQEGHLMILKLLLRGGADPEVGVDGFNALTAASQAGRVEILEALILASPHREAIMARAPGTQWAESGVASLKMRERWHRFVRHEGPNGEPDGELKTIQIEEVVQKRLRVVDFEARHVWTHKGAVKHHISEYGHALVDAARFDEHEAQFERDVMGSLEETKQKFKRDLKQKKLDDMKRSGLQNVTDHDPQPTSTLGGAGSTTSSRPGSKGSSKASEAHLGP